MKERNRWGKSDPATVILLEVNALTWKIEASQKFSPSTAHENLNLCSLWQMEGRGEASAVFWPTYSLLDLKNTSQGHVSWTWLVSKVLHYRKTLICLKISMGSSWEASLLPRTQRRWKWTPVCYGRVGAKGDSSSGWSQLHTSAPYSSWVCSRCVMLQQNKLPLKDALFGDQEKSRAQLESKEVSSALAVAHDVWTEQFHLCVFCKQWN